MEAIALSGSARTRTRDFATEYKGRSTVWNKGVAQSGLNWSQTLWNQEWQSDELHATELLHSPSGETLDIGGPLLSTSVKSDYSTASWTFGEGPPSGFGNQTYTGPVTPYPYGARTTKSTVGTWSNQALLDPLYVRQGFGATAISRCKPASPQASFSVMVAELLREGIPSLLSNFQVREQTKYFRSLGSNYLNVEFGWKPLVSDLKKTAHSLLNSVAILEDLARNSGKSMRRQYQFPGSSSVTEGADSQYPFPILGIPFWNQAGGRKFSTTMTKKTWFTGEFRYRYPPVSNGTIIGVKGWCRQILGLDLTPETLWNIAPWTWLFDWFANTGDILANVSAITEDDLVMRYGYLMQEVVQTYTSTHFGITSRYGSVPSQITGSAVYTTKSRIGASPYGFGLTWADLTPRQIAILTAIGITRRGRS